MTNTDTIDPADPLTEPAATESPPEHPPLTAEAATALLKRAQEFDSKARSLRQQAAETVDLRTHCVLLLRRGGVPMQRICRELRLTRRILEKQMGEFDEVTLKRVKPRADEPEQ